MLCREVMEVLENAYPKHAALEWDNVGLLVGRTEKEVKKVYIALDATDEVIEEAILSGADMLITHHPLLFSPLKKITDEYFIGSRVVKLLQHDISYYAMHTNYDVLGMAELSGKLLGLQDVKVFEVTDYENNIGIGRVGTLEHDMTVRECCELVKQVFQIPNVKVFGSIKQQVKRVAISPGSGKKMTTVAVKHGADVLITGDIDHHEGIDAVAQGVTIIDAGHYGLEHIFIQDMVKYINENMPGLIVEHAEIQHPFQVI